MTKAEIRFWGVRGSIPVPGRKTMKFGGNTACVEISYGDDIIICDAGTGIRPLGESIIRRYPHGGFKAAILLSHIHWDHYFGFPFFRPLYNSKNVFLLGGPKSSNGSFSSAIRHAMQPPYFPIPISAIPSKLNIATIPEKKFQVGKIEVIPFAVNHPQGAFGWRFNFPNGKSLVHVTDNEPGGEILRKKIVSVSAGADVMIHDAQYDDAEYKNRIGWGHSPYKYPLSVAADAGVKKVFLFHFDPNADDLHLQKTFVKAKKFLSKIAPRCECRMAMEGLKITL